jgi:pimeloyl-ACP methyl ester carboxylesterase
VIRGGLLVLAALLSGPWTERCQRFGSETVERVRTVANPSPSETRNQRSADAGPIRIEVLEPGRVPQTFVMRGGPRGPARMVFLHGMCGHGHGYAQSFQWSASKFGTLIAPQADIRCGKGEWAKWSNDLVALDARIQEAFRALGHTDPIDDLVIMGYSQGATRAEALARKWPERYTRLVLMGAPQRPSPRGLSVRAAVMMAGERDRQDLMKAAARSFTAAGIPATFLVLPGATHGAMGQNPERSMGEALAWLFEHSVPAAPAGSSSTRTPSTPASSVLRPARGTPPSAASN